MNNFVDTTGLGRYSPTLRKEVSIEADDIHRLCSELRTFAQLTLRRLEYFPHKMGFHKLPRLNSQIINWRSHFAARQQKSFAAKKIFGLAAREQRGFFISQIVAFSHSQSRRSATREFGSFVATLIMSLRAVTRAFVAHSGQSRRPFVARWNKPTSRLARFLQSFRLFGAKNATGLIFVLPMASQRQTESTLAPKRHSNPVFGEFWHGFAIAAPKKKQHFCAFSAKNAVFFVTPFA